MVAACFWQSKKQLASLHEMLSRVNNWSILQNPQKKTPPQKKGFICTKKNTFSSEKKSARINLKPFQIQRRKKRKQSRRWKKHNVSYAGSQLTSTLKPNSSNEEARLTFQMFRYVFVRMHYCVHVTDFCTTDSGQLFRQSLQTKEICTRGRLRITMSACSQFLNIAPPACWPIFELQHRHWHTVFSLGEILKLQMFRQYNIEHLQHFFENYPVF